MKQSVRFVCTAVLCAVVVPAPLFAHGGRLDKNGCHNDRKNGGYHCHGAPAPTAAPSRPVPPAASVAQPQRLLGTITVADSDLVQAVQILLHELGYSVQLSSQADRQTRAAIRSFETSQQMEPTGSISNELVLRLVQALAVRDCAQGRK